MKNITEDGAFNDVAVRYEDGLVGVVHTASPVFCGGKG